MQRRKKKEPGQGSQPAAPPLQPAYFDAEEPSRAEAESGAGVESAASSPEPEAEPQPASNESGALAEKEQRSQPAQREGRGRSRRRRGGRGRGGSRDGNQGREQAVAQAFTPKGVPTGGAAVAEEEQPPDAEVDRATPQAPAAPNAIPVAPPRPPKGIVVLAIGLPGSGKSSWFKRHNITPLSSDLMRTLLFDDAGEQRFQDLVFSNLRSMLKARLIAKRPMNYVDATNLTPQERQHWIKLAKDYNYEVHAVFFDVPLEVCIERHQRRDRVVPEDIMRKMASKLKPPAFDEGFAKITVVRVKKKEE